jgi:hypothetical protein
MSNTLSIAVLPSESREALPPEYLPEPEASSTALVPLQLLHDLRPHLAPLITAEVSPEYLAEPEAVDERATVADRIRNLLSSVNIAEKNIKTGGEYAGYRGELRRKNQHDCAHKGWQAGFKKPTPFPHSRRTAERLIEIFEAFGCVGHMWPKLPHGFRALHLLATFKPSSAQLASLCLSGKVSSTSTEGAIAKVGIELGVFKVKSKSPKEISLAKLIKLIKRADEVKLKEVFPGIKPATLRKVISPEQRAALAADFTAQLCRVNPKIKTLLGVSVPEGDAVSYFDALSPEEKKRFAQERGNQIFELI